MAKKKELKLEDLRYGPLSVGFMKKHKEEMKLVGQSGYGFDDVERLMPLIYKSCSLGMGEEYPGDEAIDEIVDLLNIGATLVKVFEAIGFTFKPSDPAQAGSAPGNETPAEA